MQTYKTLADVVALAEFAHRNQTDKAGLPYIEHPRRVMQTVQAQGAMPYVQMAAILHDVTEDTAFTTDMLVALGVPEAAVEIVRLVDRSASRKEYDRQVSMVRNSPEAQWWTGTGYVSQDEIPSADEFYYQAIARHPEAKRVKLADINDNLQEWRLSYLPAAKQEYLHDKYDKAKRLLNGNF